MDYSSVTSMYSDMYASMANQSATKLQEQLKNSDYVKATEQELMDACKQFEAYFVEQMYKAMMKTTSFGTEGTGANSTLMDYYKDQMIQGLAEQTTQQNSGVGLAQVLYEQMRRNYGLDDADLKQKDDKEGVTAVAGAVQADKVSQADDSLQAEKALQAGMAV